MEYIPLIKQILTERRKNAQLAEANQKNIANIDYIAMMCDVELDTLNTEEANENEPEV